MNNSSILKTLMRKMKPFLFLLPYFFSTTTLASTRILENEASSTGLVFALIAGVVLAVALIAWLLTFYSTLPSKCILAASAGLIVFVLLYATGNIQHPIFTPLMLGIYSMLIASWFLAFYEDKQGNNKYNSWALTSSLALFLLSVIFLSNGTLWLVWSVLAIVMSSVTGYHIYAYVNYTLKGRAIAQCAGIVAFLIVTLLWFKQVVSLDLVMFTCVVAYLNAAINHVRLSFEKLSVPHVIAPDEEEEDLTVAKSHNVDQSTNLPTRHQALHQLGQLINNNSKKRYAVLALKPVNFERVNTVLGHHNSDILLLQFAYCLQKSIEGNEALYNFLPTKPACRLASVQGLHFMVVLDLSYTNHPEDTVIDQLRKQLISAVPAAMTFKSYSLNFDLVFGAAIVGQDGYSADEVVSHAVDALLSAEKEEVNFKYYDNKQALYTEKQLVKMEKLKGAILQRELHYVLQPQILQSDQQLAGFSLKTYWSSGEEQSQHLEKFIDLAEQSGEIFTLFRQMIEVTLEAIAVLTAANMKQPVAIPVNSKSLLEPDIIEYIEQKLKDSEVEPNQLSFEIDESLLLNDPKKVNAFIHQLEDIGVQMTISQFSGSYEALRYLRKLSVRQVNINCSDLVESEEKNAEKVIVNALLSLCKTMDLTLIGTEINTPQTEIVYSSIGGTVMQGSAIEPSIDLSDLANKLTKWQIKPEASAPSGEG